MWCVSTLLGLASLAVASAIPQSPSLVLADAASRFDASPVDTARSSPIPRLGRVFVIVGENTSLADVTRRRAPYIAGPLKRRSAWLAGYRARGDSLSLGNYVEMTSGQSIACERADSPPADPLTDEPICHQRVDNIFHQLQVAQISWRSWHESMPRRCFTDDVGTSRRRDSYIVHHNPAVYYDNVEGARYGAGPRPRPKRMCLRHVVPMGTTGKNDTSAFDAALRRGDMARFNFVVPNNCENGHDQCGGTDRVSQFDAFVRREVKLITASPAYGPRSVIVVTYDEESSTVPHSTEVASLWLSPLVRPGVYRGDWTHASLLGTLERAFRLPLLAHARRAHLIHRIWR